MGCVIEVDDPPVRYELYFKQNRQKILIEILIHYADIDLKSIARELKISIKFLNDVHKGSSFLCEEKTNNLLQLFLLFMTE